MTPAIDEEELVREVLAENPVEERGVRDEWVDHVGWNRKENIHVRHEARTAPLLRGSGTQSHAAAIKEPDRKTMVPPLYVWPIVAALVFLISRFRRHIFAHKMRSS